MDEQPNIGELKTKIKVGLKFWLEFEDVNVLGSGWAELLENIASNVGGSLDQAAKACKGKRKGRKKEGYSYKYAWNILKRIEERTGMSPVITQKGGAGGGGSVRLNEWGQYLLNAYKKNEKKLLHFKKDLNQL